MKILTNSDNNLQKNVVSIESTSQIGGKIFL